MPKVDLFDVVPKVQLHEKFFCRHSFLKEADV